MKIISDKLIALKQIRQLASKYCPSIMLEIENEIFEEERHISRRNIRMKRKKLIGK